MLNREQRRAQLKQLGKRFSGIDITKGTLEVPVKGCDTPLTVDVMNFDTIYHLSEMCDKFTSIEQSYPEEYAAAEAELDPHKKTIKLIRMYRHIIKDFVEHVDAVFGEGATKKVFGNEAPMPQAIAEFIEDISPVATALTQVMGDELSDGTNVSNFGVAADAALRTGNA